jgi:hypothetical protein
MMSSTTTNSFKKWAAERTELSSKPTIARQNNLLHSKRFKTKTLNYKLMAFQSLLLEVELFIFRNLASQKNEASKYC